jgi:hypothetical protein
MNTQDYYNDLLTKFGQFLTVIMFITIIITVIKFKYFNKPLWIFFGYIVVTFLANLIEQMFIWSVNNYTSFWLPYLKKFDIDDTHFIQIISNLKNFLLIGWFYSELLGKKIGDYLWYFSVTLALFSVIDYFWITGYKAPGIIIPTIVGFFIVLTPMLYLWFFYNRDNRISIYKIPYFWFSIALIIAHLLGLLFYFVGEKVYKTDFILFVKISFLRNTITIIRSFVFAYGFWLAKYIRFLPKQQ